MVALISAVQIAICFIIVFSSSDQIDLRAFLWAASYALIMFVFLFLVFFLPGIHSFLVIRRLTEDTGEYSVLPLFDAGYTIGLKNEMNWFFFTTPCIHASISALPVVICFRPSSRSSWSRIDFIFTPLMREGSKRIYRDSVSFPLYIRKRLQKDIKPDVLKCVAGIKEAGLTSGVGRPISAVHFDAYE